MAGRPDGVNVGSHRRREAAVDEDHLAGDVIGRWGDPSELAGAAVFLASPAADYVTGQVIFVDGGFTASM